MKLAAREAQNFPSGKRARMHFVISHYLSCSGRPDFSDVKYNIHRGRMLIVVLSD